jgi:MoaA/NifB/PqqE/SkfB family radical SAM enzyme
MLPNTLDIRITGYCNLNCLVCFGAGSSTGHMNINNLSKFIKSLPDFGVKNIVFSGGEPLLVNELTEILSLSKSKGLKIVLTTNGLVLHKRRDVLQYIDWIGLPLDGDSRNSNALMRGNNLKHFDIVLENIQYIKKYFPEIGIKLGTVVSSMNYNNIEGIVNIIRKSEYKPDLWKLYQVVTENRSMNYVKIDDRLFNNLLCKLEVIANTHDIPIYYLRNSERDGRYLFINPNGDALCVNKSTYTKIGNIFENIKGVIENIDKYVGQKLLNTNFNLTYPNK